MKNLFDKDAAAQLLARINKLPSNAQHLWGKMDVAQMLAHCAITMEMATGQRHLPRVFIGRILGPLVKPSYLGPKPFPKNSPTDKNFIVTDQRNFDVEKKKLITLVRQFADDGEAGCTRHPHAFFGKLTPTEWAASTYKHLDHHLQQFGA